MQVRIGTLIPEITAPTTLDLPSGAKLTLEPLVRRGNRIGLQDFDPCVVVLNNDLSAGVPAILENLEQQVIPPLFAGWATRRKSRHFTAYSRVAAEFARLVGHRSLVDRPVLRRRAERSTSRSAPARSAWLAGWMRCSRRCAPSTRSTASIASRS